MNQEAPPRTRTPPPALLRSGASPSPPSSVRPVPLRLHDGWRDPNAAATGGQGIPRQAGHRECERERAARARTPPQPIVGAVDLTREGSLVIGGPGRSPMQ